ncbi:unnamed protein product [marine sediment metagenome]|uniref:Uncharacterized protein n=1 Tax=marine sediment metagenome TaxID=412755 RepID=X0Z6P7_9ZZZZ
MLLLALEPLSSVGQLGASALPAIQILSLIRSDLIQLQAQRGKLVQLPLWFLRQGLDFITLDLFDFLFPLVRH